SSDVCSSDLRGELSPIVPVPGPGVVEPDAAKPAGACLSSEEDHFTNRRIVGHVRPNARRRAMRWMLLGPGLAVPRPSIAELAEHPVAVDVLVVPTPKQHDHA